MRKRRIIGVGLLGALWVGCALSASAAAQTPRLAPGTAVVDWLDAPYKRLSAAAPDLLALEQDDPVAPRGKNMSVWESAQFPAGAWTARTVFFVVQGRVKRIEQNAQAPSTYCLEDADWGELGQSLSTDLGVAPMVYVPTTGTGAWQQAALWHSKQATVVVYRTAVAQDNCWVRVSVH